MSKSRITGQFSGGGRRDLAATPFLGWKLCGGDSLGAGGEAVAAVSARKLAAALWRLAATTNGGGSVGWQCGLIRRLGFEIPNFASEGVTKWDHWYSKASNDASYSPAHPKLLRSPEIATASVGSPRRLKLSKAQKCVNEIEPEHKKKISIVKNLNDSIRRERKICKKMDKVNSKLLGDIAEVKLSARKVIKNLQKEKRTRLLLEDVCIELAKEIEAHGAEIGALKIQRKIIQEEVEKERKMLQLAEVWREERAQMKLKDARLILERKYAEMSDLIANLQTFSRNSDLSRDVNLMSIANILRWDSDPVNIQGTMEFSYLLPKSDHKFKLIKEYSQRTEDEGKSSDHYDVNEATGKSEISHEEGSVNKIRRSKYQKSDSSGITSVSMKQPKKKGSYACKVQRNLPRNKETCKRMAIDSHDLSG